MNMVQALNPPQYSQTRARGLSLVELMIAMTLGLLLLAVVITIFISSGQNSKEDERLARMQENGRFAIEFLITDLGMAALWGSMINTSTINTAGIAGKNPCAGSAGFNLEPDAPIAVLNNPASATAINSAYNCVTASDVRTVGTPDVLVIKRVKTDPLTSGASHRTHVYLDTDPAGNTGMLSVVAESDAFTAGRQYWQYIPRIYYIRKWSDMPGDGIPTLVREELNGDGTGFIANALVGGVENVQVEFGIDTDSDGTANFFSANPTATELPNAVNVQVHVLMRSLGPDPGYENTKTYRLGNMSITYPLTAGTPDRYYRRVFTTTVTLRNVVNTAQWGRAS